MTAASSAEEAVEGADVVVVATSSASRCSSARWLGAGRPRQRGRRELADRPRDRHRDGRRRRAVLRQPRVGAQRGRRVPAGDQRGADRRRGPHPRRARRGAGRRRSPGRRDDDELTLFRSLGHRRRGPRRRRARRPHARARRGSGPRSSCDRPRGDRGGPRADRRRSPCARRSCACTLDDAPAEIYLQARDAAADQLVQDPRRRQRDPLAPPSASGRRGWSPPAPATWRRASRGWRASSG